jgi:hypothetical protein
MVYAPFIESNRRMLSGIALSFFLHAMVLSLAAGFSLPKGKLLARHELDVYLPAAQPENKSPPEKILLSRTISTYRASGKSLPVQAAEVVPEKKTSDEQAQPAPQGLPIGFSFPRAIGLPWLPPEVSARPVQPHERPIEAYRAMYEAEQMAAHKPAVRAQMIGALTATLEEENQQTDGHCSVSQSTESHRLKLDCDSIPLEKMLREKHADALTTLFGVAGAFEIAFSQSKVRIMQEPK